MFSAFSADQCILKTFVPTLGAKIVACLVLLCASFGSSSSVAAADALDPGDTARRVAASVVHITGHMGEQGMVPYAEASGFFVEDGGILISVSNVFTNSETHRLCERYVVRLSDGRVVHAKMFSVDPILNLIILKIVEPGTYPTVETDFAAHVRPGDEVIAVAGETAQSGISHAAGYVTARHKRSIYGAGLGDILINTRITLPAYAHGGPLLNEAGKVIGVNTPNIHRLDSEGPAPNEEHALPLRVVRSFAKLSTAFPTSEQNWIGVAFRPLSSDEKSKAYEQLGQPHGLLVDYVWSEGPAGQLDIQPGDVLFSMNDNRLWSLHQLDRLLWHMQPDTSVDLAFLRQGKQLIRQIKLKKRPAWAGYVHWQGKTGATGQTNAGMDKDS